MPGNVDDASNHAVPTTTALPSVSDAPDVASFDGRVATLRGAHTAAPRTGPWRVVGLIVLLLVALSLVVSFFSAANDNARIARMKSHGIPVMVSVTNCVGQIGGSGSNNAGFVCQGTYRVRGTKYHESIGSMTTFATFGTLVHAVADPAKPSTIVLATALDRSTASDGAYLVPSVLSMMFVAVVVVVVRRRRRPSKA